MKRKEEKECEHSVAMCSHPKRINTRGTGQHTRHHHHEHLEMGKWKEYAFQILSGGYMHLFPTSAIHIRLASKSQQGDRNCATRFLVSHGLMRSTPISAHYGSRLIQNGWHIHLKNGEESQTKGGMDLTSIG